MVVAVSKMCVCTGCALDATKGTKKERERERARRDECVAVNQNWWGEKWSCIGPSSYRSNTTREYESRESLANR